MVVEDNLISDERLIAEAAREDSDGPAFTQLVQRHRQRVWRVCYRLMDHEHDATDATQEVFVRLFANRARFEGRSRFTTWLHGIAVRTCLTLRRGRSRRQRRESAVEQSALEYHASQQHASQHHADRATPAANTELSLDVYRMLDVLDEEDRAMMIMKYAEGHTFEELADLFGLGVSACKMRLSRARETIQKRFPDQNT
jgi:RNA polymerase sigma-70 factor (ECF subfamily)